MGEPNDPAATPAHAAVFLDPTGRRAKGVRIVASVVVVGALLLLAGFLASLARPPSLQSGFATAPRASTHLASRKFAKARKALFARIAADRKVGARRPAPIAAQNIVGGYFAPWVPGALDSFQAHAGELTHIYPVCCS